MKDELITFETAKLAKEKGFKLPTHSYYFADGEFKEYKLVETNGYYGEESTYELEEFYNNWNDAMKTTKNGDRCFGCDKDNKYFETYSAPSQSLLQRWLREKYDIHIEIRLGIKPIGINNYRAETFKVFGDMKSQITITDRFNRYESALEAALIESLKLI